MNFQTQRLQIRPVSIEDTHALYRYRSDPGTYKYLGTIPESVDDIADLIKKTSREINIQGTWFQFVIIEQFTNSVIGDIGLHFLETDSENKQVEIGYTLDKAHRGKGYATEALKTIIDYLFNQLNKHRVIASIDPINTKSINLIKRLGFRKEAHFVKSLFFHGQWVDDVIYAILAEEWKTKID